MNWFHYFYYKLYKSAFFIEKNLFKLRGGPTGAVTGLMGILLVIGIIPLFLFVSQVNREIQWVFEIGFLVGLFVLFWYLDKYFERNHKRIYNQFKEESRTGSLMGAVIVNLVMALYLYVIFKYVYP